MSSKVLVIGLDCAPPEFIFRDDLPNIKALRENGAWGVLKSTIPPITVPAWMSMMTSRDPGQLGLYGFRNRRDYSYNDLGIATSLLVDTPALWDILDNAGKTSIVIGLCPTYPPKPINGVMVSGFLTPNKDSPYTYPTELKEEIERVADGYIIDVENFRTDNKDWLLQQIYDMTRKRFRVVRHLLLKEDWDLFVMVEMGPDRLHHGFWKYTDPGHRKYTPHSGYESSIKDYYRYLDEEIGEITRIVGDGVGVIVVSDHGARRLEGGVCINEWLIQQGHLTLKEKVDGVRRLNQDMIDWQRTVAWGEGGYYGRIFLNVKGREPCGVVEKANYEKIRDELIQGLMEIRDDTDQDMETKVYRPEDVYRECRRIPPDLIVYFGNLAWRSIGSVGFGEILTFENDTGPDDANHSEDGVFIMGESKKGWIGEVGIEDVAPTILNLLGLEIPGWMEGRVIE
jgi:predicted AlkP superfamily phosphohydrolase/phosphomutase